MLIYKDRNCPKDKFCMIPLMNEVPVWVLSHVQLFVNPRTVPCHIPLSMESFRQEHWSGLPFPNPEYLPNPGIEPRSPVASALQVDSLPLSHMRSP